MKVTIKDIALEAGVSTATVSKVINNKMYVADETKEKVLEIIKKYNYTPHQIASSLSKKSSHTIIYIDMLYEGKAFENPHSFEIFSGIANKLKERKYNTSIASLSQNKKEHLSEIENFISSHSFDAIIINGALLSPEIEKIILNNNFPILCLGKPSFETFISWIDTNHKLSSKIAVDHLLNNGKGKIAFMGGHISERIFSERLKGYKDSLNMHDIEIVDEYIKYNSLNHIDIEKNIDELLLLKNKPDCIICSNSFIGYSTVSYINKLGIKIPNDISIIVFDDFPYGIITKPSPSIVDIDFYHLGTRAADSIYRIIKNPSLVIQSYTTAPEIKIRNT